jgi:prepilin signal peptidase PulO-like enzyme (type II secretory pathway)
MYFIIVFAMLGLFIGSFLNVCIDWLPKGESIVTCPQQLYHLLS